MFKKLSTTFFGEMIDGELSFTYTKYIKGQAYKLILKPMSHRNLEKVLRKELEALNDVIDHKIIKGLSYAKEARRHKFILNNLADIRRAQTGSSWIRSFSTFSII